MCGSPPRPMSRPGIRPTMRTPRSPPILSMSLRITGGNTASPDKSASRVLAEKLAHVQFSDFPDATIHKAKLHILDTLGAALAGASSPEARAVWQALALR